MHDSPTFTHCTVIDATGHKVGTVSDVVSDPETLEPRWLVVDVGLLHTGHYMPVAGSRISPEGELLVPFEKDTVQRAPKAHGSHVLSSADEGDLYEHYGLHN
jgi:sporulation protein YlmC with PRC-barrel domain